MRPFVVESKRLYGEDEGLSLARTAFFGVKRGCERQGIGRAIHEHTVREVCSSPPNSVRYAQATYRFASSGRRIGSEVLLRYESGQCKFWPMKAQRNGTDEWP